MEVSTEFRVPAAMPRTVQAGSDPDAGLRQAARSFEAVFLSEMLKHAGVGSQSGPFGDGIGGEQFASLLRDAQANDIATNGGLGLAENIFNALKERQDAR